MKRSKRTLKRLCLKEWSRIIKERDKTCQWCGKKVSSHGAHAHHIVAKSLCGGNVYCLTDPYNGILLCYRCHIHRLKSEIFEYTKFIEAWLTDNTPFTYDQLRDIYRNPARLTLEDYEWKLQELRKQ